jgi:hypothetical protein
MRSTSKWYPTARRLWRAELRWLHTRRLHPHVSMLHPSTWIEQTLHMACSSDSEPARAKGHRTVGYPGWHMGWARERARRLSVSAACTGQRPTYQPQPGAWATALTGRGAPLYIPFYIWSGGARTEQACSIDEGMAGVSTNRSVGSVLIAVLAAAAAVAQDDQPGAGSSSACSRRPVVFAFGDSNTDTGGAVAGMGYYFPLPEGRAFFHRSTGRLCDGRLVIDYLCESFHSTSFLAAIYCRRVCVCGVVCVTNN